MKQLESWNGRQTVKLWMVETNKGTKRTWKKTSQEAHAAAKSLGLKVKSVRPGTEWDALVA